MKMRKVSVLSAIISILALIASLPCSSHAAELYSCISKAGKVRVVSNLSQCKSSESPFTWNSAGSQGPAGPPGPAVAFSRYLIGQVSGLAPAAEFDVLAACSGSDMPIGGGFDIGNFPNETKDVQVWTTAPDGNGWRCRGRVLSQTEGSSVTCYVSCLHTE